MNVDRFRSLLLEERRRAADALDFLRDPGSGDDETREPGADVDVTVAASVAADREMDSTLEEAAEQTLAAVEAALERIERGTFGTCESCGQAIGDARLEAMPHTTKCIECKREEERS